MSGVRFKLQRSRDGKWFFEIQAGGNYRTLAHSETYNTRRAAIKAMDLIALANAWSYVEVSS